MPIMPPVSILIMKLERWRSPIPRIQWLTHSKAWELTKWDRRDRKASGLLHIFRKALLDIEKVKTIISIHVLFLHHSEQVLNLLQQVSGHVLRHLKEVVDRIGPFRFPGKEKRINIRVILSVKHKRESLRA